MVIFCACEGVGNQPGFGLIVQNTIHLQSERVLSIKIYALNKKCKEQEENGIILYLGTQELNELSKSCWTLLAELRFGARLDAQLMYFFPECSLLPVFAHICCAKIFLR